jgi:hypothetical protein
MRQFGDLDILIHEEDISKVKDFLPSLGYEPDYPLEGSRENAFLQSGHHYTFYNKNLGTNVEIHWRISQASCRPHVDLVGLWARAEKVSLFDRELMSLSPRRYPPGAL